MLAAGTSSLLLLGACAAPFKFVYEPLGRLVDFRCGGGRRQQRPLLMLAERCRKGKGKSADAAQGQQQSALIQRNLWDFKRTEDRPEGLELRTATRSRSRSSRRSEHYASLSSYSDLFAQLLALELRHEKEIIHARLADWPASALQRAGFALLDMVGAPRGRLFADHVVRFSLPPLRRRAGGPVQRPELPFHRFAAGDVVAVTQGCAPPDLDAADEAAGGFAEAVVLERTPHFVDVVLRALPAGLSKSSGGSSSSGGGGAGAGPLPTASSALFRLDQYVNGVSYERMLRALRDVTTPGADAAAADVRGLVVASLLPFEAPVDGVPEVGYTETKATTLLSNVGQGVAGRDWAAEAARPAFGPAMRKRAQEFGSAAAAAAGLNDAQERAVKGALAQRLTLIQGPPGTGKTKTACAFLLAAARMREGGSSGVGGAGVSGKVMACAFSNVATDGLLEGALRLGLRVVRIGRPASVRPALRSATLDALLEADPAVAAARARVSKSAAALATSFGGSGHRAGPNAGGQLRRKGSGGGGAGRGSSGKAQGSRDGSSGARASLKQARSDLEAAELAAARAILLGADVVVCSCIGAGTELMIAALAGDENGAGAVHFSTVLVDEATQATEPACLVPLVRGCQQLVLVGDQQQLPPTILSRPAEEGGLGRSLFVRLLQLGLKPILLDRQYRAHPFLAQFPSNRFYGSRVKSEPLPEERPAAKGFAWPRTTLPLAFVAVTGGRERRGAAASPFSAEGARFSSDTSAENENGAVGSAGASASSWCNVEEAAAVGKVVSDLLRAGDVQAEDIGVITPYAAQARLLSDVLRRAGVAEGVEVDTVDGFQGREKEVILLSAVRSNGQLRVGFLADWRRLNVAITRARRGLVVFGNPSTLAGDAHWDALISHCRQHNVIVGEAGS